MVIKLEGLDSLKVFLNQPKKEITLLDSLFNTGLFKPINEDGIDKRKSQWNNFGYELDFRAIQPITHFQLGTNHIEGVCFYMSGIDQFDHLIKRLIQLKVDYHIEKLPLIGKGLIFSFQEGINYWVGIQTDPDYQSLNGVKGPVVLRLAYCRDFVAALQDLFEVEVLEETNNHYLLSFNSEEPHADLLLISDLQGPQFESGGLESAELVYTIRPDQSMDQIHQFLDYKLVHHHYAVGSIGEGIITLRLGHISMRLIESSGHSLQRKID